MTAAKRVYRTINEYRAAYYPDDSLDDGPNDDSRLLDALDAFFGPQESPPEVPELADADSDRTVTVPLSAHLPETQVIVS